MSFQHLLDKYRKQAFSERDKGDRFERLMQAYLQTDPKYAHKFKNVWLWEAFKGRADLGDVDTGIDLVALTHDGDYWAIQCKCFQEEARIDKPAVDSFLSTSSREFKNAEGNKTSFAQRLWISTTNKWGGNAEEAIRNQNPPVARINLYDLQEAPIDWTQLEKGVHGEAARTAKKSLYAHQREARDKTREYFGSNDRGKLIMACGTGKTFTALRIAENETEGKGLVLFLVPSIALLGQTLREWSADAQNPINAICICSDPDISKQKKKNADNDSLSTVDLAYPASTNPDYILHQFEQIKQNGTEGMTVVFSTYQSIEVIAKAQQTLMKNGFPGFDLIICDEAHRTTGVTLAGEDESAFVKVHDANFIQANKRIYMTATPRLYDDSVKSKAAQAEAILCSMDDPAQYGEEIYRIGFGEAVERELLTDYKVLILTLNDQDVPPAVQKMIANDDFEINTDDVSKLIGTVNALSKKFLGDQAIKTEGDTEPMKRAVAFCANIATSKKIADSYNTASEAYLKELPPEQQKQMVSVEAQHMDGTMTAPKRDEMLGWLKEDIPDNECRVISNVRVLSEGVDVPSLDAVLFLSARNSQVDVVQSVGRVMRRAPGKKYGYIVIPVVVPADVDANMALDDNERYKVVWTVLNALRAHDDRFNATVNKIELNRHKPNNILVGRPDYSFDDRGNAVAVANKGDSQQTANDISSQMAIQFEELQNVVYARMVKKVGDRRYWEEWAKDIAVIAQRQIERIENLIKTKASQRKAFASFLAGLQKNINPSITEGQAVEMLAQHIITKPIFDALFEGYSFTQTNAVSVAMQGMLTALEGKTVAEEDEKLQRFYESVRKRAAGIDNAEGKQRIIVELYDKFFRTAFPRMVEQLGIVYTPVEVVDFIIHSVNDVLKQEFGRGIGDENVHILDPFTGTGTFMTRLLQSGLIETKDLARKYRQELHANEIVLLAYYIAAVNIENAFHDQLQQELYGDEIPPSKGDRGMSDHNKKAGGMSNPDKKTRGMSYRNTIIPYNPALKEKARELRKNSTLSEILLWKEIQNRKLGFQFHRQVPIDQFIVDFYCHELMLAIEIDGSSHDSEEAQEYDQVRQERLESLGVRFIRIEDRMVRKDMPNVLRGLEAKIEETQTTSSLDESMHKSPLEGGTHGKSPLEGGTHGKSPIEGGTHGKSPIEGGTGGVDTPAVPSRGQHTESPFEGETHSKSPLEEGTHSKSPVEGGTHGKSPLEGETHSKSPIEGATHGKSPLEGGTGGVDTPAVPSRGQHTESPIEGETHSKSPIEGGTHSKSPIEGETHSKSPIEGGTGGVDTPAVPSRGHIPYEPFEGIVLTDTFQLGETDESEKLFSDMFPKNSARVERQKKAPLRVIMGNPPYSVGQKSANDNAQNLKYEKLDRDIANTYAKATKATNKNSLYDSYIKAFRWSTDRLDPEHGGVIAFVSNGAWLDGNSADGFRKTLEKEFTSIWVFNLRGNQRTAGELSRKEGGKIFGSGSRTPIAITLLVKNPNKFPLKGDTGGVNTPTKGHTKATIHYHDIGDYHNREEKLRIIHKFRSMGIAQMPWKTLQPNEHGDWLNPRNDVFESFVPIGDKKHLIKQSFFDDVYSRGLATARDAYCYASSQASIKKVIEEFIEFYETQRIDFHEALKNDKSIKPEGFLDFETTKVTWNRGLKNDLTRNHPISFRNESVRVGLYRPFFKQHLYFARELNDMVYQLPKIFPSPSSKNLVICTSGVGANKDFSSLISNCVPDLQIQFNGQCFPLYYYEKREKESGQTAMFSGGSEASNSTETASGDYIRHDGVSDFILNKAQKQYGLSPLKGGKGGVDTPVVPSRGHHLSKEDIFYYVYGLLHSPDYRTAFANDLKKMLPRLPLVDDVRHFWKFSKAGRQLADLHINYESVPPAPGVLVHYGTIPQDELEQAMASGQMKAINYRVEKMRFPKKGEKDRIQYNSQITLSEIPAKAYDYVVNGKSAIEWILERYQVKTDKKSGIKNDPNDWATEVGNEKYILELLLSVINVSVQTVDIVAGLPKLSFDTSEAVSDVFAQGKDLIAKQYGTEPKWQKLSEALFELMQKQESPYLYLHNFVQLAEQAGHELDDVLAVIGLLSMPGQALIKQEFATLKGGKPVPADEVYQKLRAYWRDKSLSEAAWQAWASEVEVKWKVLNPKED